MTNRTTFKDIAFLRDAGGFYTGDQLFLALMFHTKGVRTEDNEKELARILDDPNQSPVKKK